MSAQKLTSSIALCTYNGERFLQKQLDSYTSQIWLPDELIVCDDGSQDATLEILENFRKTAPFPVEIHRNEQNLGFAKNFEKSALLCTKDIVFFSDQDDIWLPRKLQCMMEVFQREPEVGMVLSAGTLIDENDVPLESQHHNFLDIADSNCQPMTPCLMRHHRFMPCAGCYMAYRNELRCQLYPIGEVNAHDEWTLLLLSLTSDVRLLSEVATLHRMHGKNTSAYPKTLQQLKETGDFRKCFRQHYDRHLDPTRFIFRALRYVEIFQRCDQLSQEICHPEILEELRRLCNHNLSRAEAISHFFRRPRIIWQELRNGNYKLYSHSLRHALGDLLTPAFSVNLEILPESFREQFRKW